MSRLSTSYLQEAFDSRICLDTISSFFFITSTMPIETPFDVDITGASSGIGEATALHLKDAMPNARLHLIGGRRASELLRVRSLSGAVESVSGDLFDSSTPPWARNRVKNSRSRVRAQLAALNIDPPMPKDEAERLGTMQNAYFEEFVA